MRKADLTVVIVTLFVAASAFSVVARAMLSGTALRTAPVTQTRLEVVVEAARSTVSLTDGVGFHVALRNIGTAPLLLNAGVLLGNGQQIWSAVTCTLRPGVGAPVPLGLTWQVSGVAGRLYFLGVPLRPGDSHSVTVTPADYHLATPLQPGRYELRCTVTGTQSTIRDATQLPACWEGVAASAPVFIQITAARRTSVLPLLPDR